MTIYNLITSFDVLRCMLLLPFAGAMLVKLLKPSLSLKAGFAVLAFQLILAVFMMFELLRTEVMETNILGIGFGSDGISFVFALTSVIIGLLIFLFSGGYFAGSDNREKSRFSFWSILFVASMMGVVFSDNLISLYCFWELAGLCSWRLIGFYRKDEHLVRADNAFLITAAGAGAMFLGFAYIFLLTGTMSLSNMAGQSVPGFAFVLIFAGVIAKSATFPLHTWLPGASVAPTPVTSFLHAAVLVKIGIYGLIRIFGLTLTLPESVLWAGWLALASSFIAGFIALRENDVKKILAYSTVSQLGFMLAGILVFNEMALLGVVVFYIAHALGKGCLFLCAGNMEKVFGTRDAREMSGVMKKMPLLSYAFFFSMLSVTGIPPLPGFFGKLEVIKGMIQEGYVGFAFFAILTSVLTLLYMFRLFKMVFMGPIEPGVSAERVSGSTSMSASIFILGTVTVSLGVMWSIVYFMH